MSFDASITFSNGGGLTASGFRVDVPSPDVGEAEIAALFVASLGLLITDAVRLDHVEIFAEPHKGTRGGGRPHRRLDIGARPAARRANHVISAGMITYPGLPGPARPASDQGGLARPYAPGPSSRSTAHPGGQHRDLPGRALSPLPGRRRPQRDSAGPDRRPARHGRSGGGHRAARDRRRGAGGARRPRAAVLLHTGDDAGCGTSAYAERAHSSPGPGPRGWPPTGRRWSASTRSTSMTPATAAARPTRCCWRRAFPSSSSSPASGSCRRPGPGSSPRRRGSRGSAPSQCARSPGCRRHQRALKSLGRRLLAGDRRHRVPLGAPVRRVCRHRGPPSAGADDLAPALASPRYTQQPAAESSVTPDAVRQAAAGARPPAGC